MRLMQKLCWKYKLQNALQYFVPLPLMSMAKQRLNGRNFSSQVGCSVGIGAGVGRIVGCAVGFGVGRIVGCAVGFDVGFWVGFDVGFDVGVLLGGGVGNTVSQQNGSLLISQSMSMRSAGLALLYLSMPQCP